MTTEGSPAEVDNSVGNGLVKRAIIISYNVTMDDGGLYDRDNPFGVKNVSEAWTEKEVRDAKIKTLKCMCLQDLLLYLHKVHEKAAHYQTLGIEGYPYQGYDTFYDYVYVSCMVNEPSKIQSINSHYVRLCEKNDIIDGGSLF